MAVVACRYSKLLDECTNAKSALFPDICTGHVSHVFGLSQSIATLPVGVARPLSHYGGNEAIGIVLIAQWKGRSRGDDVVFNENDTVIAFSEYKMRALEQSCLVTDVDDDAELLKQREFARALSEARFSAASAAMFPPNSDKRKSLAAIASVGFRHALTLAPNRKPSYTELLSNKPIYVSTRFRLSKPLRAYFRRLQLLGDTGVYEPMMWNTLGRRAVRPMLDVVGIGELDFFRHHNSFNLVSTAFDGGLCREACETEASVIANKMTEHAREIFTRQIPKGPALRRSLRRALLNQYDDSPFGSCSGYFVPTFPDVYSARALSVISMLCVPLSTARRPAGKVAERVFQEYFCDDYLYRKGEDYGIGGIDFVFARAFAALDGDVKKHTPATKLSEQELTLATSMINNESRNSTGDDEEMTAENDHEDDRHSGSDHAGEDHSEEMQDRQTSQHRVGSQGLKTTVVQLAGNDGVNQMDTDARMEARKEPVHDAHEDEVFEDEVLVREQVMDTDHSVLKRRRTQDGSSEAEVW